MYSFDSIYSIETLPTPSFRQYLKVCPTELSPNEDCSNNDKSLGLSVLSLLKVQLISYLNQDCCSCKINKRTLSVQNIHR